MASDEEGGGVARGNGKSSGDSAIEAFSLFKTYLDSQLKDFKQDLCSIKTSKDKKPKLKSESNKHQFEFNSEIQEGLERALCKNLPEGAQEILQDLLSKVKHRNKLIQVADCSPGGWLTVNEYEKPLLGSDSDDEKRLRQAETRAITYIKTSKPSTDNKFNPYKRSSTIASATTGSQRQPRQQEGWGHSTQQSFRAQRISTGNDICFSCGQRGHFRRDCRANEGAPRRVNYYYADRSRAAAATTQPKTEYK